MSLNALLEQPLDASSTRFSDAAWKVIASSMDEMRQMKIESSARGAGDYLPKPILNDAMGWALPVPATFAVDMTDRIVLADIDGDDTRRLEPTDALAV